MHVSRMQVTCNVHMNIIFVLNGEKPLRMRFKNFCMRNTFKNIFRMRFACENFYMQKKIFACKTIAPTDDLGANEHAASE